MSAFDLLRAAAGEGGWSEASQIVVLCNYLDQLSQVMVQLSDADILLGFRDFLDRQVTEEHSYDEPKASPI